MKNKKIFSPKPEFLEFQTSDGLVLPGLLYRSKKGRAVVIYLHGNGSSSIFYNAKKNQAHMASTLVSKSISIFYFNNRGAHFIKTLYVKRGRKEERRRYGMSYEKIKECVPDIDGAVSFLKKQGYREFYLAGASTGANKICVYNFYKPRNEFKKYVLLCGGDDVGIYYHALGKNKFWKLLSEARRKIKSKKSNEIIKDILPDKIFSYGGFFDIANPDGDYNVFPFYEVLYKEKLSKKPLFRYFKKIKKQSLVVYGDKDEYSWGNVPKIVNILKQHKPELGYKIIEGADHGFKNREKQLAEVVTRWLSKKN